MAEEPDAVVSESCFDQTVIDGDKNKHDQCVACCMNKIGECYSESSRLACVQSCLQTFPFNLQIATETSENDENETRPEQQERANEEEQQPTNADEQTQTQTEQTSTDSGQTQTEQTEQTSTDSD